MATYNVRCRHNACRHRRVSNIHPFDYKVVPRCSSCGNRKGWRIEPCHYHPRKLCRCNGPLNKRGEHYPHETGHPYCDHHPNGFYNQAKRAGIEDDDIPLEYHPKKDCEMVKVLIVTTMNTSVSSQAHSVVAEFSSIKDADAAVDSIRASNETELLKLSRLGGSVTAIKLY